VASETFVFLTPADGLYVLPCVGSDLQK
jgi:hypothetical protein